MGILVILGVITCNLVILEASKFILVIFGVIVVILKGILITFRILEVFWSLK